MARKNKRAGKFRLPKKVAGYKIPKVLRKSDILIQLIQSPRVREVCAAGMMAAAAALVGNKNVRQAAGDAASKGSTQFAELVSAIGSVALALLGKGETKREDEQAIIDDGPPPAETSNRRAMPVRGNGPH